MELPDLSEKVEAMMPDRMPDREEVLATFQEELEGAKSTLDPARDFIRREGEGDYVINGEIYEHEDGLEYAIDQSLKRAFNFWIEDDFPDNPQVYFADVRESLFRVLPKVLEASEEMASAYNGNGLLDLDKMPDGWETSGKGTRVLGGLAGLIGVLGLHLPLAAGGGLVAWKGGDLTESMARWYHERRLAPRNEFYQALLD